MPALRGETWRAMETALSQGKCKAIGVSNFTVTHLEQLKKTAKVMPMVNQVEMHPYYNQAELRKYCEAQGIVVQAYASLGGQDAGRKKLEPLGGPLMEHPNVVRIAKAHGVTSSQVTFGSVFPCSKIPLILLLLLLKGLVEVGPPAGCRCDSEKRVEEEHGDQRGGHSGLHSN